MQISAYLVYVATQVMARCLLNLCCLLHLRSFVVC